MSGVFGCNCGKSSFLYEKTDYDWMAMFNSYVKLPEVNCTSMINPMIQIGKWTCPAMGQHFCSGVIHIWAGCDPMLWSPRFCKREYCEAYCDWLVSIGDVLFLVCVAISLNIIKPIWTHYTICDITSIRNIPCFFFHLPNIHAVSLLQTGASSQSRGGLHWRRHFWRGRNLWVLHPCLWLWPLQNALEIFVCYGV